jgi:hypothetical protein
VRTPGKIDVPCIERRHAGLVTHEAHILNRVHRNLLIHLTVLAALVSPGLRWLGGGVDAQETLARTYGQAIVAMVVAPASAAVIARAKGGHDLWGAGKSHATLAFTLDRPLPRNSPTSADAPRFHIQSGHAASGCRAPPKL